MKIALFATFAILISTPLLARDVTPNIDKDLCASYKEDLRQAQNLQKYLTEEDKILNSKRILRLATWVDQCRRAGY